MKKYSKVVLIFLIMASILGRVSFASSKGMSGAKAMEYLEQLKNHIAFLTSVYGTNKELEEQEGVKEDLEVMSKHPQIRPILEKAFEDGEREGRAHKISPKAEKLWWNNFYAIRKTYLGK